MANSMFSSSVKPHFFKPILPGFNTYILIPEAFDSNHLEGRKESNTAELISDVSDITWKVKMDGRRLTNGWEKFAEAHDLQVGDILVFRHEGNLLFHVTPFGPSCCEILYSQQNENNVNDKTGKLTGDRKVKKNPINECSLPDTNFVIPVTASNQRHDSLILPKGFTTSSGLSTLSKEIIIMDEKGRSWTLELRHHESRNRYRVKRGWRVFCCRNGYKTGCLLRLLLVQNGKTPVIRIFPLDTDEDSTVKEWKKNSREVEHESAKEEKNVESLSMSDNSSFVVSVTVANLEKDRLYLPARFSRSNRLDEFHQISLINKEGRKWTLSLNYSKTSGRFTMTHGWKSFCKANGQKPGCSFLFKLDRTRTTPMLLMTSEDSTTTTHRKETLVRGRVEEKIHQSKLHLPITVGQRPSSNGLRSAQQRRSEINGLNSKHMNPRLKFHLKG